MIISGRYGYPLRYRRQTGKSGEVEAYPAAVTISSVKMDKVMDEVISMREDKVLDAVRFLSHERLLNSHSDREKRDFLIKKGLTEIEVQEAMKRVRDTLGVDSQGRATLGVELAQRLATVLQLKAGPENSFGYHHRDYCGDTVWFEGGRFYIGPLGNDGWAPDASERLRLGGAYEAYISFASEREFIDWMAVQTDAVFAGRVEGPLKKKGWEVDNQTLSIGRIQRYCGDFLITVELVFDQEGGGFRLKNKATGKSLWFFRITMEGLRGPSIADYETKYLKPQYPSFAFEYVLPDGTKVDRRESLEGLYLDRLWSSLGCKASRL